MSTARNISTIDAKTRANSTGRNTSRNYGGSIIEKSSARQQSIPPYNKSPYMRASENKYKPKEFFKAAEEYLGASANRSLGDPDQNVKKILDDKKVQTSYN